MLPVVAMYTMQFHLKDLLGARTAGSLPANSGLGRVCAFFHLSLRTSSCLRTSLLRSAVGGIIDCRTSAKEAPPPDSLQVPLAARLG